MCMGSQAGALKNELHKTDYRRLNLGVAAAAIALMAVRTLHWDMQSALGHLETVFQGGLTGTGAWSISSARTYPVDCAHCAALYSIL